MQTYGDMQTAVGALLERSDSYMATKIKVFLNDAKRYIDGLRPWTSLLRQTTFQSVAGLDYFITDTNVDKIIDVSQHATPIVLALTRYYNMLQRRIDVITTSGNPVMATPAGNIGIMAAMPSDGTISIVSSSANDTTQIVTIQGYITGTLVAVRETLTLTGTTPVVSSYTYSAKSGYEPQFSKNSDTAGVITVTTGSTVLAYIPPQERAVVYAKWKVWPIFASSITMYLTYKKKSYGMSNPSDVTEVDCANALIMFAYARCLMEKRQISKAHQVMGIVDQDGKYPAGSFQAEIDSLIAREPVFSENFIDQFQPIINKDSIDQGQGQTGYQLWPASNP